MRKLTMWLVAAVLLVSVPVLAENAVKAETKAKCADTSMVKSEMKAKCADMATTQCEMKAKNKEAAQCQCGMPDCKCKCDATKCKCKKGEQCGDDCCKVGCCKDRPTSATCQKVTK